MTIGYELYAKGVDRLSVQCNVISNYAKELAIIVRENPASTKKRAILRELQVFHGILMCELEGIIRDVDSIV